MRIHRGIGVELHIAFGRRILEDQIHIPRPVHSFEIVGIRERRFEAAQFIQHSGRAHVLIDGIQAGGRFRMSRAHLVAQAIGVGDIGRGHKGESYTRPQRPATSIRR